MSGWKADASMFWGKLAGCHAGICSNQVMTWYCLDRKPYRDVGKKAADRFVRVSPNRWIRNASSVVNLRNQGHGYNACIPQRVFAFPDGALRFVSQFYTLCLKAVSPRHLKSQPKLFRWNIDLLFPHRNFSVSCTFRSVWRGKLTLSSSVVRYCLAVFLNQYCSTNMICSSYMLLPFSAFLSWTKRTRIRSFPACGVLEHPGKVKRNMHSP